MHFELSKVENVETSISGMKANINWPRKWLCHEGAQAPVLQVDACYGASNARARRRSHRSLVSEERDKHLSGPNGEGWRRYIKFYSGCVRWEAQQCSFRHWKLSMICQDELRRRPSRGQVL